MENEFTRRVRHAIEELEFLKIQYMKNKNFMEAARLNGKIEGLQLGLDYYKQLRDMKLIK